MKLHADATIDIDNNRKIWISADAECDPQEVDIDEVAGGLTSAVTTQALAAYEQVVPRYQSPGLIPAQENETARLRGEGKEVAPTATFGDDED